MMTWDIEGLKELDKVLTQLPDQLAKKALQQAAQAGARVLIRAMREAAPVDSGRLKQSIGYQRGRRNRNNADAAYLKIGISTRLDVKKSDNQRARFPAMYGRMVEFGTSKMPARPWARPAIEQNSEAALKAQAEKLAEQIQKLARNLAGPLAQSGLVKRRRQ